MKWILIILLFFIFESAIYSWGYSDGIDDSEVEEYDDIV